MSDIPVDDEAEFNMRAVLTEIDRDRAETRRLQGESNKRVAEQRRLIAGACRLIRDRWLVPLHVLLASLTSGTVVVISHFWRDTTDRVRRLETAGDGT